MIISGLTIIRNGIQLDYPFLEAVRSALFICDEYIVVVGKSDDGTLEAVQGLNEPRVRVIETVWSARVRPQGSLLAQQTNVGLHLCRGDWVVYLQANEVLHESSLPLLFDLMKKYNHEPHVEALLFERLTFWGDYRHVITVYPERYKFSPRIVRPYIGTYSIRDAMSFAVFDRFSMRGRYPRAVDTGEYIFRYGRVLSPHKMSEKVRHAAHIQGSLETHFDGTYLYQTIPRQFVGAYRGTHPKVMEERIRAFPQRISLDDPRWRIKTSLKERQRLIETWYYKRFGMPRFRNTRYRLIGNYVPKRMCE